MGLEILARRGLTKMADGVADLLRLGGERQLIVNDSGLGRYAEMVLAGKVFTSFVKTVTVAATHNTPIAANTATPVVGFGNVSANVAAVILRVGFQTTSGTPAGSTLHVPSFTTDLTGLGRQRRLRRSAP